MCSHICYRKTFSPSSEQQHEPENKNNHACCECKSTVIVNIINSTQMCSHICYSKTFSPSSEQQHEPKNKNNHACCECKSTVIVNIINSPQMCSHIRYRKTLFHVNSSMGLKTTITMSPVNVTLTVIVNYQLYTNVFPHILHESFLSFM